MRKYYTGCKGYWRPIFKIVPCISRLSDHDKIFTVYPLLHLLVSSGVHLPVKLKGPQQENQRAVIAKKIRQSAALFWFGLRTDVILYL